MLLGREKVAFLNLPTPLEYLKNISEDLGVNFYIKRDDLTNMGAGGNKLRKLEYILQEAKDNGATMLMTVGGVQTNHGRLTAAVATKYGMKCAILTIGDYPGELSANLLLDRIMGADVIIKKDDGRPESEQFDELIKETIAKYEAQGEKVHFLPMGGSDETGVLGYYECAMEITKQAEEAGLKEGTVYVTVGSMGTYTGIFSGLKNEKSFLDCKGVAILPFDDVNASLYDYYNRAKAKLGMKEDVTPEEFKVDTDYIRGGYNLPSKEVREAIEYMARKEAILMDPCYTGKCFAGILDMIKEGKIKKGENIIMIHTGGFPGLYTAHHRVEFEKELIDGVYVVE